MRHAAACSLAALSVLACRSPPAPSALPSPPLTSGDASAPASPVAASSDAAVTMTPTRAPTEPDASATMPPADAAPAVTLVGQGVCAKDDDCIIDNVPEPCWGFASCEAYGISREVDATWRRRTCAHPGEPPPNVSPCPTPRWQLDHAVCADHVCGVVAHARVDR